MLYGGGGGLGSHGAAPVAVVTGLDLAGHVGDGVNTYGYLRGRMRGAGDPSGLAMWGGWGDTLMTGAQVVALASGVTTIHQFAMSEAVDWATDWSRDDNEIGDIQAIASSVNDQAQTAVDDIAGAYGPMIAGAGSKIGTVAIRGLKFSTKTTDEFKKWLMRGPSNVQVYVHKINGKLYVGITNDRDRRAVEHGLRELPAVTLLLPAIIHDRP